MDAAYEHISEEEPTHHSGSTSQGASDNTEAEPPITLTTEFQQAYQAVVSSSPWGAKLGGFFGQVKKQSESLYSDAQKEYASRSEKATKGLSGLLEQTRNISLAPPIAATGTAVSFSDPTFTLPEPDPETSSSTPTLKAKEKTVLPQEEPSSSSSSSSDHHPTTTERPDSLPADIVKEATNLVSRFRTQQAPSLLKRVQKAEDAADEALLKFGTNMKNWLRDAVTVTGPDSSSSIDNKYGDESTTELLFETNDAEGKRVFHSSRFEAQLHVIHSTPSSFLQDSDSGEYAGFEKEFDVERQTEEIAKDLDKYEELRRAMEKLVPEKVDYVTFWRRYYFLRKVVGEEERRRKEVLKGEHLPHFHISHFKLIRFSSYRNTDICQSPQAPQPKTTHS